MSQEQLYKYSGILTQLPTYKAVTSFKSLIYNVYTYMYPRCVSHLSCFCESITILLLMFKIRFDISFIMCKIMISPECQKCWNTCNKVSPRLTSFFALFYFLIVLTNIQNVKFYRIADTYVYN